MEFWQVIVLAVVQGVTEFLPISSSGHLVVGAQLLGGEDAQSFDVGDVNVVLHLGTLGSILVFYWRRIWSLLGEDRRVLPLLAVGTIPAVLVGVPIELFLESALESPLLSGCLLIVTGVLLLWMGRTPGGERPYQELTRGESFLIGMAQAAAILPGLSRSGATICAGMGQRLNARAAATFSFLLAIPAIGGAGVLKALSTWKGEGLQTPPLYLLAGALVSFLVGWLSLQWLVGWLERGRLWWFAWWCIPLGLLVIAWQFR